MTLQKVLFLEQRSWCLRFELWGDPSPGSYDLSSFIFHPWCLLTHFDVQSVEHKCVRQVFEALGNTFLLEALQDCFGKKVYFSCFVYLLLHILIAIDILGCDVSMLDSCINFRICLEEDSGIYFFLKCSWSLRDFVKVCVKEAVLFGLKVRRSCLPSWQRCVRNAWEMCACV